MSNRTAAASRSRRALAALIALPALVLAPWSAPRAADFPKQPIEMTVLFGGSSATIAQILADAMAKQLGVPVAAVSRTGAGGAVGYSYVKTTPSNGYNIVWNSNSISTAYHAGNMDFDYRAFDGVALVGMEVPALAVRTDSGWKTLKELGAAARKQKLRVGVSGRGAFTHLVAVALFDKLGAEVIYVPYGKGSAPAELLGGRIEAAIQWPNQFQSHAEAGTLRVLAVTGSQRVPVLPDVPTAKEQGIDVDMTLWRGVAAPRGTPREVIARLEQAVRQVVESPAFKERAAKLGFEPAFLPAAEFDRFIAKDDVVIARLMEQLGLKKSK